MALMVHDPSIGLSSTVGKPGNTGRTFFAPPSSGRSVAPSSSATSDSDLMQLFADARYNSEQYNSAEAEKNRKWQEYMSNTAHQREVQDLLAAGLNPVLSVTGGNGASTPAGSEAQLADNSSSIMSLIGSMMSAGAVVGAAAISANSAFNVATLNAQSAANVANINASSAESRNATSTAAKLVDSVIDGLVALYKKH